MQGWLTTTVVWGGFLCAMVFLMVCINTLVRKQWTEHEKLSYPIIQLPLELTSTGSRTNLLRNKMMWLGFGIAGAIDILNGLHHLYPTVPSLGGRLYDLRPFFTQKPWSAIGWDTNSRLSFRCRDGFLYSTRPVVFLLVFLSLLESRTYFWRCFRGAWYAEFPVHR